MQEKQQKSDFKYYEIYNASEGFFAIQDRNNSDELLLMLDYGIFYEFIPMHIYATPEEKAKNLTLNIKKDAFIKLINLNKDKAKVADEKALQQSYRRRNKSACATAVGAGGKKSRLVNLMVVPRNCQKQQRRFY